MDIEARYQYQQTVLRECLWMLYLSKHPHMSRKRQKEVENSYPWQNANMKQAYYYCYKQMTSEQKLVNRKQTVDSEHR